MRQLPSGRWQVRGTDRGKPYKNSYALETQARQKALELVGGSVQPLQPTWLTRAQLRDAEAVFRILPPGVGLLDAARAWMAGAPLAASAPTWEDAIEEYTRLRSGRATGARLANVLSAVRSFAGTVGPNMSGLTRNQVESWLAARLPSDAAPATYNHLLADLSTFLAWHAKRGTIPANPCAGVDRRKTRHGTPTTITPEQAEALLRDVEKTRPAWVPFIALLLFAGVRPGMRDGECRRLDDALRAGKPVLLPGGIEVHGKTGAVRVVPWGACGPLREWLDAYPLGKCLVPDDAARWERDWTALRRRHGLPPDVLRHTAASCMTYSGQMTLGEVAMALGNSEAMLRRHYVGRWSREMTQALYALRPAAGAAAGAAPGGGGPAPAARAAGY